MRIGWLAVGGVREWRRVPKIGVPTHLRPMGPSVIADLDTLLIALYVELTDRIIPTLGRQDRAGPGRPATVTDAELVCLAVAQVLLRYHDEHHWLRAAPSRVGHLFPRLLSQPAYNRRLRQVAWLLEAALRWLADHTPASSELLRLLDGTPVPCGRSRTTATRSELAGWAGDGHDTSHHCFYWGSRCCWSVPRGDGDRVRAGQPQTAGRTRGGSGHAPAGPGQPAGTGHAAGGRQGLCRRRLPGPPGRPGPWLGASGPCRRARPWELPQLAAAAHRGDHLDPQAPARPGPAWRPHSRRAMGARGPAPARPQHRDLVQLADRRPNQALPDRLRPLTPLPPAPKITSTI